MSNAFTADREVRTTHKRISTGTLKACVAWINRNRRKNELITVKTEAGLYPSDTTVESRRD